MTTTCLTRTTCSGGKAGHGTQPTSVDFINTAFSADSYQPQYNGQGQWTHAFSPNATNQFVYAGSYYRAIFTQNDPQLFPFAVIPVGYTLTQVGGAVYNFPQGRNVTQYQFVDDFSYTKGAHDLKFGANFRRYDITDYTFSVLTNPEVLSFGQGGFYNGIGRSDPQALSLTRDSASCSLGYRPLCAG